MKNTIFRHLTLLLLVFALTFTSSASAVSVFASAASSAEEVDPQEAVKALKNALKGAAFSEENGQYNLLFIGSDRRDDSWNGNSDSMILVSVNSNTQKIHLMSFMRDLYSEIEGYGVRKLNSAFAIGGADLLMSTLSSNYGVTIDNYVSVNFNSLASVIDSFGGVEITVTDAELPSLNSMASSMARTNGSEVPEDLPSAGTYNLSGYQAVSYSRIRKIGNNDYQRTERQRTVLEGLLKKARAMDAEQLAAVGADVLAVVDHDLSAAKVVSLMAQLSDLLHYSVEESRVPFDGMYYSNNEILTPSQPDTNEKIQEILND
ncbi:MAG: LCP family protein [Lachnospiraceae bacterium]|nr:LCP family protein [Lachnospiraceae bacterium]